MGYFKRELEQQLQKSIKNQLKVVPQFKDRTDNAYLNQLSLDQDIFNGLLPELERNLNK
jgi:hypothetical protein